MRLSRDARDDHRARGVRRGARDVPQRAGQRRTATAGASGSTRASRPGRFYRARTLRQLVPARVPRLRRRSSQLRGQPLDAAQRPRAAVRPVRPRLLAAGLLPRRADRADGCSSRSRSSTAAVGRVWCGWLCPQTIFMEMLFRKIEYLIDGSAAAAAAARPRAVDAGDACGARVRQARASSSRCRSLIANVFLAYIIGAGRALGDRHRSAARSTWPGSSPSRSSASCSTASSRGSASRRARWPARTAA